MNKLHFHEEIEILLCLTDGGEFFIEDKYYQMQRGSLFVLNKNILHKSIVTGSSCRYAIHILPDVLEHLSTLQTDFIGFIRKLPHQQVQLEESQIVTFHKHFQDLDMNFGDDFGDDVHKTILLLNLLLEVYKAMKLEITPIRVINLNFEKIAPIIEYIHKNIMEPLTLDSLSAHFFINKHYMCHIFKDATGNSVTQYIIQSRVNKARELLRSGLSVQQVSEIVGFHSVAHFIRTFGSLTGMSPKRYAKEYLNGECGTLMGEAKSLLGQL
jgi:AraC-like DNA-binding protein